MARKVLERIVREIYAGIEEALYGHKDTAEFDIIAGATMVAVKADMSGTEIRFFDDELNEKHFPNIAAHLAAYLPTFATVIGDSRDGI